MVTLGLCMLSLFLFGSLCLVFVSVCMVLWCVCGLWGGVYLPSGTTGSCV